MWSTRSSGSAWRPLSLRLEEGGGELLHPQTHMPKSLARTGSALPGANPAQRLRPSQLRPDPILELPYRILLRHQYAPGVRQGAQSTLIELADFGILTHDDVCELNRVHEVAFRIGQRFGQEEKLDAHLRSLRSERQ